MTLKEFLILTKGFKSIGLYDAEEKKLISQEETGIDELYLYEDFEIKNVNFMIVDGPKDKNASYIRVCIYLNVNQSKEVTEETIETIKNNIEGEL